MIRASLYCTCCQKKLTENEKEKYQKFNWQSILGDDWNPMDEKDEETEAFQGIMNEFTDEAILHHDPGSNNSNKRFYQNKSGKLVVRSLTIEEQFQKSREKNRKISADFLEASQTEIGRNLEIVDISDDPQDELLEEQDKERSIPDGQEQEDEILFLSEEDAHELEEIVDIGSPRRKDPFLCLEPDIDLPPPSLIQDTLNITPCLHQNHQVIWKYETMFVEVKGPTDRLSDTQHRWIHILNSNDMETVICHVKEGKIMGIAGGYHQTSTTNSD